MVPAHHLPTSENSAARDRCQEQSVCLLYSGGDPGGVTYVEEAQELRALSENLHSDDADVFC
jgi:hypothetical protein